MQHTAPVTHGRGLQRSDDATGDREGANIAIQVTKDVDGFDSSRQPLYVHNEIVNFLVETGQGGGPGSRAKLFSER